MKQWKTESPDTTDDVHLRKQMRSLHHQQLTVDWTVYLEMEVIEEQLRSMNYNH